MTHLDDNGTLWLPLSAVAREFHKTRQTLSQWCRDGFILTLGYRARRDPKGQWFLAKVESTETTHL